MKFITSFALAFILIFIAILVEASEYYPVGITKEHKEVMYKEGCGCRLHNKIKIWLVM